MNRLVLALGAALVGAVGMGQQAGAVQLQAGSSGLTASLTIGNETISETSCLSTFCTGMQMVADPNAASNGAAFGFILESYPTAGSAFLTGNVTSDNDITIGLQITGSLTNKINSDGLGVAGTIANSQPANSVNVGESITGAGSETFVNANAGITWINLTPGQTSLTITKDMTAKGNTVTLAGNTMTTVTQDFRLVPEPATAALLFVGIAAAGGVRRLRRRA
jgi:hypothetical protein